MLPESMMRPSCAESFCNSTAAAETVTVSLWAPISSATSSATFAFASTSKCPPNSPMRKPNCCGSSPNCAGRNCTSSKACCRGSSRRSSEPRPARERGPRRRRRCRAPAPRRGRRPPPRPRPAPARRFRRRRFRPRRRGTDCSSKSERQAARSSRTRSIDPSAAPAHRHSLLSIFERATPGIPKHGQ